jgi:hypothetical protein
MMWAALLTMQGAATAPDPQSVCRREERGGSGVVVPLGPDRACRRFRPPRSYTGIWIDDFEGSRFVEGAHTVEEARRRAGKDAGVYWLSIDRESRIAPVLPRRYGTAYRLRLDAQEMLAEPSAAPVPLPGFGHMSMSHREILVNEVHVAEVISTAAP